MHLSNGDLEKEVSGWLRRLRHTSRSRHLQEFAGVEVKGEVEEEVEGERAVEEEVSLFDLSYVSLRSYKWGTKLRSET
jgi:hypothetical protein